MNHTTLLELNNIGSSSTCHLNEYRSNHLKTRISSDISKCLRAMKICIFGHLINRIRHKSFLSNTTHEEYVGSLALAKSLSNYAEIARGQNHLCLSYVA